jgi:hypothetical protein
MIKEDLGMTTEAQGFAGSGIEKPDKLIRFTLGIEREVFTFGQILAQ